MTDIEVIFFDVLGTVVDWRGTVKGCVADFLVKVGRNDVDASNLADAWVGSYDHAAEAVRLGKREYVNLDTLNMENLERCLLTAGIDIRKLAEKDLKILNESWHHLRPWSDSIEGVSRIKRKFIVAPLSDGHTRLLIDMAKRGGLPWDTIIGSDVPRSFKPDPRVYLNACALLDVSPQRAMLVAAHAYDLESAKACGFKTALVKRAHAADPSRMQAAEDYTSVNRWDYEVEDLVDLANELGCG